MVTQWFDPEPTFMGLAFAKELVRRGHEVQVLTGFPNYPGGHLYTGYKIRARQVEERDGVSVLRVPLYPSHDASAIRRVANYGSFALSVASLGSLFARRADVMFVYQLPTLALGAAILARARGIPLVYNVQDLWPDALAATGMARGQRLLDLVGRFCKLAYTAADRVVVQSPGYQRQLLARGVEARKVSVIYNWFNDAAPPSPRDPALARELGMSDRFNVVFAGNMGKAQALDAVVDAASMVAASRPDVQFVFIGDGVDEVRLRTRVRTEGLRNCLFVARRPMSEMGRVLALGDALLVHLRDEPSFQYTIPSKTQAYMAAGRPLLMAVRGDAAALVASAGAGLVCAPEDPAELAASVVAMHDMAPGERERMGVRAREFYDRALSMESGVNQFEAVFKDLVGERRGLAS